MFVKVKAYPCSKENKVIKKAEDSLEVRIREKPQEGRANEALLEIVADYFGVPREKIRLIKGRKQRNKIIEIKEN